MNDKDGESSPMGFNLNLNSTSPVPTDDAVFPPVPIINALTKKGLLLTLHSLTQLWTKSSS